MRLPACLARLVCLPILCVLLCQLAFGQKPKPSAKPTSKAMPERSSLVERVGPNGFIQVEAESFRQLTDRQQMLAYWLSMAAIAIDPIIYDQMSRFGLRQKRILDAIVSNPKGMNPSVAKKILDFTKLFWANKGNHNETTAQKFLPTFTYQELEQAGLQAIRNQALLDTPEQFRKELSDLKQSLFDPAFEPLTTAKNPRGGLDIIQGSANNFYSGVSLADLKDFKDRYPLDSRVVKVEGRIVEQVYRAGTPDGSVPAGLYADYLSKAIGYLEKARAFAEPGQANVIDDLIRFYRTGETEDWLRFDTSWVQNNAHVDFANGFIEVYRDARGAKGTSQAFVSITDERLNKAMVSIAENAQYFENRAPWAEQYKKQGVRPPLAKAVETVVETGDFGVTTVGDNLPNENVIREKYGTKSYFFTGSTRALNRATGFTSLAEFASSPEELAIVKKYGDEAEDLETAMHEVIGHGSGKVNPKLTQDPSVYLKEYYSTLEEARADLMALWNIWDPKLKELGLISHPDVAKAMYYDTARAALTQLRSIPEGDQIEEDHQRDRQMIVNYIMDKTGAIERVERGDKSYMVVKDFEKMRQGVGLLLAELMRIKGEGDYAAIKALVDKYGVHFDPKLRDQVVARYKRLNLPTYWTGINAKLTPKLASNGQLMSVEISYPRNYVEQQLEYASMYNPALTAGSKPSTRGRKR